MVAVAPDRQVPPEEPHRRHVDGVAFILELEGLAAGPDLSEYVAGQVRSPRDGKSGRSRQEDWLEDRVVAVAELQANSIGGPN